MPSFVARTHQARSALLRGTKHFGEPSVSPDSSLIPLSGSNLTRQLVSELWPIGERRGKLGMQGNRTPATLFRRTVWRFDQAANPTGGVGDHGPSQIRNLLAAPL
jgi:hypothetical protein